MDENRVDEWNGRWVESSGVELIDGVVKEGLE